MAKNSYFGERVKHGKKFISWSKLKSDRFTDKKVMGPIQGCDHFLKRETENVWRFS